MRLQKLVERIVNEEYNNNLIEDRLTSFEIDESLLGEDYPSGFNFGDLNAQTSYASKKKYIEQHLKKIGSGSARDVYYVDPTKVLKLAKNQKGVAQNQVENQYWLQDSYSDVVALVFEKDTNDFWHEMELAKKINKKRFQELTGVNFDKWSRDLRYILDNVNIYGKPSQEEIDAYYENEFTGQVIEMAQNAGMPGGDLARISTYGEVSRNGSPRVVVVDYGLDQGVFNDHYKRR